MQTVKIIDKKNKRLGFRIINENDLTDKDILFDKEAEEKRREEIAAVPLTREELEAENEKLKELNKEISDSMNELIKLHNKQEIDFAEAKEVLKDTLEQNEKLKEELKQKKDKKKGKKITSF